MNSLLTKFFVKSLHSYSSNLAPKFLFARFYRTEKLVKTQSSNLEPSTSANVRRNRRLEKEGKIFDPRKRLATFLDQHSSCFTSEDLQAINLQTLFGAKIFQNHKQINNQIRNFSENFWIFWTLKPDDLSWRWVAEIKIFSEIFDTMGQFFSVKV